MGFGETVIVIGEEESTIIDIEDPLFPSGEICCRRTTLSNSFSIDNDNKICFGQGLQKAVVFTRPCLFSFLSMPNYQIANDLKEHNILLRKMSGEKWQLKLPSNNTILLEDIIIDFFYYIIQRSHIPVSLRMLRIVISPSLSMELKQLINSVLFEKYDKHFQLYERPIPLLHSALGNWNPCGENLCILVEWSNESLECSLLIRSEKDYTLVRTRCFPSLSTKRTVKTLEDIAFAHMDFSNQSEAEVLKEKQTWRMNTDKKEMVTSREIEFVIQISMKQISHTLLTFLDECGTPANAIQHINFVYHDLPFQYPEERPLQCHLSDMLSEFFTENQFCITHYSIECIQQSILSMKASSIQVSTKLEVCKISITLLDEPFIEMGDVLPLCRGCVLKMEENRPEFLIPLKAPGLKQEQLVCTLLPNATNSYEGVQVYLTCSVDLKGQVTVRLLDLQQNTVFYSVQFSSKSM